MAENKVYSKGDYVVYKKRGIYLIEDIRKEKICSQVKNYYLLLSVYDKNSAIYVPADSEQLVGMMERVLTKEEIEVIIKNSKESKIEWIADGQERQMLYDQIFEGKCLSDIICLMKLLLCRKEQAVINKSKIPAIDERALNNCTNVLSEAFAFSLGIEKKDVQDYILSK